MGLGGFCTPMLSTMASQPPASAHPTTAQRITTPLPARTPPLPAEVATYLSRNPDFSRDDPVEGRSQHLPLDAQAELDRWARSEQSAGARVTVRELIELFTDRPEIAIDLGLPVFALDWNPYGPFSAEEKDLKAFIELHEDDIAMTDRQQGLLVEAVDAIRERIDYFGYCDECDSMTHPQYPWSRHHDSTTCYKERVQKQREAKEKMWAWIESLLGRI